MTAPPQFPMPQGWGAQPPAPAQQFAQAPGGYAPPQQPQFPQQFQAPAAPPQANPYAPPMAPQFPPAQPGYAPAGPYGAPPQYDPYAAFQPGLPQGQPPQVPAFTPAGGTLDEYVGQRETGAKFWKWTNPSDTRIGMVERELRDTDVRQVSFQGRAVQRMDGSVSQEKSLCIPLVEQDGTKWTWEVKGHNRTKLTEVCRAAGVENGLPEGGSMLRVTFTHRENVGTGGAQRKVLDIQYARPNQVQGGVHSPAEHAGYANMTQSQQPDLQYATPVPGAQQYAQPAMQSPPVAPQQPQSVPGPQVYDGQQWQQTQFPVAPQQAAPAQQFPPQAAFTPQAQPAPVPSPTPAGAYPAAAQQPGSQGPPAPQPYAPPGMDPAAAQMFANLVGGAAPQ